MPGKRYTHEEILQHLWTVKLDTGKGLAVFNRDRRSAFTAGPRLGASPLRVQKDRFCSPSDRSSGPASAIGPSAVFQCGELDYAGNKRQIYDLAELIM